MIDTERRQMIAYIDAQIRRGYYTTRYVLIPAGDTPELYDVPMERWFDTLESAESYRQDQIQPDDWQVIEVATRPAEEPAPHRPRQGPVGCVAAWIRPRLQCPWLLLRV